MSTSDMSLNKKLENLCTHLMDWQSRFPEQIDDIQHLRQGFAAKLERLASEELRLSIGIMGQVKAGKSSFLNALLFDGRPVLPEAATPKTANLTRISYGEKPRLTIDFYSLEEWASIQSAAASTSDHAEARVGRDLLKMVAAHGIEVASVLAQGQQCILVDDIDGLMDRLNDYVGENGRYTALVKSTEIQLPLEELIGFDVVDTPGMNDPVPSRTQKTREYMAQCDVVFFLSRCSQFLDQSDMDLLAEQLPGNGVKRMVLVAGQFDGAISDDGYDRASLTETELNIKTRLSRRAEIEVEKLATFREQLGHTQIANLLRSLKTPIFTSTYAYGLASLEEVHWGKGMRHMHEQLLDLANSSWNSYRFTKDDWRRIGNFDALTSAYHDARADKQAVLQAQRDGLIPETQAELQIRIQKLIDVVESRVAQLRDGDIKTIEYDLRACESRIQGISIRLAEIIDKTRAQAESVFHTLKAELGAEANQSAQLKTRTGTKTKKESYDVSTSTWYKPWTWGDTETVYYTTSSSYEYIATSDAIEQVVNFGNENAANLLRAFNNIISLATLRADLKRGLIDELNTHSVGFNPANFRTTLEGTLSRLVLPELKLELGDTSRAISNNFSGKVRSEKKMEALREAVRNAINTIHQRLVSAFKYGVDELNQELANIRDSLHDELVKDLRREQALLITAFENKEQELQTYMEIIEVCTEALKK